MNKFEKILVALLIIVIVFLGVLVFNKKNDVPSNLSGVYAPGTTFYITSAGTGNTLLSGLPQATTTGVYLSSTATASSTILGTMGHADQLDMDIMSIGSSTSSVLAYSVFVANPPTTSTDCTAIPTACEWINVDQLASADTSAHITKDIMNTWNVSTTSVNVGNKATRHFIIAQGVIAKYFKVSFGTTGANQFLWASVTTKESATN